jgi:hypothetical protein
MPRQRDCRLQIEVVNGIKVLKKQDEYLLAKRLISAAWLSK